MAIYKEFLNWKFFFLFVLLLNYILWVATLVVCAVSPPIANNDNGTVTGGEGGGLSILLPFPLAIYAWSWGQSYTTLGILKPVAKLLTEKAWESFEYKFRTRAEEDEDHETNKNATTAENVEGKITTTLTSVVVVPPMDVPILNVQDYITNHDDDDEASSASGGVAAANAAVNYLATTYGIDWMERPLLLKGLWTQEELTPDGSNSNRRARRQLTPLGLLNMTELRIPYFQDARVPGALEPDAIDSVSKIIEGMIYQSKPYKIGSQFIVKDNLDLVDEVVPPNAHSFLPGLFGNHFTKEKVKGTSIHGIQLLPGTTAVPLFIANTMTMTTTTKSTSELNETNKTSSSIRNNNSSTCDRTSNRIVVRKRFRVLSAIANLINDATHNVPQKQPRDCSSSSSDHEESDENETTTTTDTNINDKVPPIPSPPSVTGLHCEPIANVAVQLWGSRTWTLVDTKHSWKVKPTISKDGRSFYPSSLSAKELDTNPTIPRYVITTHPGDALWLPTWTYHKVEYTTTTTTSSSSSSTTNSTTTSASATSNEEEEEEEEENNELLVGNSLSIGASLFHFRPYDYIRRNPVFAFLLLPSLLQELAGTKTQ